MDGAIFLFFIYLMQPQTTQGRLQLHYLWSGTSSSAEAVLEQRRRLVVAIIGMVISHRQTTVASGVARNLQQRMEMVPETTSFHA